MRPGAPWAGAASLNWMVEGKAMLAATATTAAAKVPSTYSHRMGRICVAWPGRWLLVAETTSSSTSTGATALRAEMNSVPSRDTDWAASGQSQASRPPATRLMAIWPTRLVRASRAKRALSMMVGKEKEKTQAWKNAKRHARGYGACHNVQGLLEGGQARSEEHTSELQSQSNLVCRLLLEKKKQQKELSSEQL